MAKEIGIAIGGGAAAAILFFAPAFGGLAGVLLAYLLMLPLFAAGFGFGAIGGLVAAASATVLVGMAASFEFGVAFAVIYAVPAAGLIRLALWRRGANRDDGRDETAWYPPGHLLAWLAVYGGGLFALLAFAGGEEGIAEIVNGVAEWLKSLSQFLPAGASPETARTIEAVAGYAPATVLFGWTVMVIVNAVLAEALLAKAGRAIRPAPRYAEVELPGWYAAATAGMAAIALVAPWLDLSVPAFVARNAALAMLAPFFLVGLAVIHVWSRRWPARMAILTGCYAVLVLFGWPALLVAGLGFMEQWLLLRRQGAGGTGQEEER